MSQDPDVIQAAAAVRTWAETEPMRIRWGVGRHRTGHGHFHPTLDYGGKSVELLTVSTGWKSTLVAVPFGAWK